MRINSKRNRSLPLGTLAAFCLTVAVIVPAEPAGAIIVADNGGATNPAANLVRPTDIDPGWNNVGMTNNGTAIYLGNRYVLTAAHVGVGAVTFSPDAPNFGGTYAVDNTFAAYRLTNPAPVSGPAATSVLSDLLIYRLANDPDIAPLAITATSPIVTRGVRFIGTGITRGSSTQDNTVIPPNGGYLWSTARSKGWGDDNVAIAAVPENDGAGGQSFQFRTQFGVNPPNGSTEVGATMATQNDSGSAVFVFNNVLNRTELAGVVSVINTFKGQPGNTAGFGNQVGIIDLSFYANQFPTDVPEPTLMGLALPCAALLARRRCA